MTEIRDYVEGLGVQFREGAQGCAVNLENHGGALFPEMEASELRSRLNESMKMAVAHYTSCSTLAGIQFSSLQLMEVSFRVVLYILIHRFIDMRALRQKPKWNVELIDLRSTAAKTRCWVYCESMFPNDYQNEWRLFRK